MNRELNLAVVTVSDKAKKSIQCNHPWVFEQEVLNVEGNYENGDLVDVFSLKNKYLGSGFISEKSKIRIRIISRNANDRFDDAFYERRLRHAWEYRKTVMQSDITNCRIIFGEADFFPGLTVDRFNNFLVTQTLSLGIEKIKHKLFPMLIRILREDGQIIDGLYERNDVAIRELEGLDQNKGWFLCEELPTAPKTAFTQICENGITYDVDVENGQKTGFFLDQKYNRLAISKLTQGKHVLDCFTHTGSFALNAGIAGAQSVLGVDASETAVLQARRNASLNGLDGTVKFLCEDVFELLPELEEKGEKFDVVVLDPPAFTKSRSSVKNAIKGYREINLRAMRLVKDGGFLATCSCSHFMTYELFTQTIGQAAKNVHKRLRQVEYRTQAPDHPILWSADESYYLKFYIFQVCNDR